MKKSEQLKIELHKAIDNIDDDKLLKAVHTILSNSISAYSEVELSEEEMKIVEERKAKYKSGKSKTYTVSQAKKQILKNLGK